MCWGRERETRVRKSGHSPVLGPWGGHRLLPASGFFLFGGGRMMITVQDWSKAWPRWGLGQLRGTYTEGLLSLPSCFIVSFPSRVLYFSNTLRDSYILKTFSPSLLVLGSWLYLVLYKTSMEIIGPQQKIFDVWFCLELFGMDQSSKDAHGCFGQDQISRMFRRGPNVLWTECLNGCLGQDQMPANV